MSVAGSDTLLPALFSATQEKFAPLSEEARAETTMREEEPGDKITPRAVEESRRRPFLFKGEEKRQ